MRRLFRWLVPVFVLSLTACEDGETQSSTQTTTQTGGSGGASSTGGSGGGGQGGGGGTSTGGGNAFQVEVNWKPCPLDSKKTSGSDAECADVTVPADWENAATSPTISVFVKRWPVLETPAEHHGWLIQGGPGGAGSEWDGRVKQMAAGLPDVQLYFLDPRGVGRSTRLGCPNEEAINSEDGINITLNEWPSCLEAVKAANPDTLPFFTTTQTAKDLGEIMKVVSGGAKQRTVLGQSYGTYLLQRWLHFYPDLATHPVLDSLANPGNTFTEFGERTDAVGHEYLKLCGADTDCAARLGPSPDAAVDQIFTDAFEMGGCAAVTQAGLDRAALARDMYGLLTFAEYRPLIISVLYRLARCNAEDVDALTKFNSVFNADGPPSLDDKLFGVVLHHHIILSEMWDSNPPTPEAHAEVLKQLEFGLTDIELDTLLPTWPKFGGDPLASVYPQTQRPLLMLNGTLDAQTPLFEAIKAKSEYTGEFQHFITVPGAPHGAIAGEAWSQPAPPCSLQIVLAFAADAKAPVDESCFSLVDPLSFAPSAATSQLFFGIADPWGDGPPPPPPLSSAELNQKRAELKAKLRHLRRHQR